MEISNEKKAARIRWQILAQVLRGGNCASIADNNISVRRFQTFGLLKTSLAEKKVVNGTSSYQCEEGQWFDYTCKRMPEFFMRIRHLDSAVSAERLNGFNNTGNVCVWPSEEVMAFYCMQHVQDFKDQQVCELGGGMTCLAGVALGVASEASHIEITDGNEESVNNLHNIIKANDFGHTTMSTRVLRWGEEKLEEGLIGKFDIVLCADCLFFDTGREDLAYLVYTLLKPGGKALMFAPSRGKTFDIFADIAASLLEVKIAENYDKDIWNLHTQMKVESPETYNENLHYPLLMTLTKALSRDSTPESR